MPTSSAVAYARLVSLVREGKGWTQEDLAGEAGVSQAFISKVESGLVDLAGDRLTAVAEALGCPPDLLTDDLPVRGLEITCLHHRRRSSKVTATARKKIEAVAHLSRVTVESLVNAVELDADLNLARFDIDAVGSPSEAAAQLRALWRVPSGPIDDFVGLLERAGIVLHVRPLGTAAQDAVSSWPTGRWPVMLVNSGLPTDRQRFTVAHELGHLVMHSLPSETIEPEANEFAGAFLAPADDIGADLAGLTTRDFPKLVELKTKWGLSVAALIQRAKDLDQISERQFREFQIRLNRLGWKTVEPVTLEPEIPTLLSRIIDTRLHEGSTLNSLARDAHMTEDAFTRHFRPNPTGPAVRTRLRTVADEQ